MSIAHNIDNIYSGTEYILSMLIILLIVITLEYKLQLMVNAQQDVQ